MPVAEKLSGAISWIGVAETDDLGSSFKALDDAMPPAAMAPGPAGLTSFFFALALGPAFGLDEMVASSSACVHVHNVREWLSGLGRQKVC